MGAIISECGQYRYTLTRDIKQPLRWVKPCLFIMLNPSTADAEFDDRTIKKCMKFAKREGCTSLTVVNLFAFRSKNPKLLLKTDDPKGPYNTAHIIDQIEGTRGGIVICAWTSEKAVRMASHYIPDLLKVIRNNGLTPQCFKINKDGNPKHPLYVRDDQKLIEYDFKRT